MRRVAMHLALERRIELGMPLGCRIQVYIDFADHALGLVAKIEGKDVREVIVVKIVAIELEHRLVVGKHYGDGAKEAVFLRGNSTEKGAQWLLIEMPFGVYLLNLDRRGGSRGGGVRQRRGTNGER